MGHTRMSDKYQDLAHNPIGRFLVKNLGLPDPPYLDRYTGGPLVDGTVLTGTADTAPGGGPITTAVVAALRSSKIEATGVVSPTRTYKGIVFDASAIGSAAELVKLTEFFTPVMRNVAAGGRIVLIGRLVEHANDEDHAIAQRALEGFTRSVAKEIGNGGTANLVYVARGAHKTLESTLGFLLSPKSAYVSGQVIRVGTTGITAAPKVKQIERPLAGRVALVTGASRGLGLADLETLARDGATVIGLDVAALEDDLKMATEHLGGTHLVGDVTDPRAGEEIAEFVKTNHGKLDILVHNAGITRDKRLRNMRPENWSLVVDISLGGPKRITDHLLSEGLISDGGRIIGIASIAGIAGNNGQTNYASAKAGVIGWIQSLAPRVAERNITANVIAPGFMETEMTKTIPLAIREAGRRMNSMAQGGLPVDVAEAIAWLASPGSQAVSGNVIGVNGQMLMGAS
jgi:3-oxoacyl-[acyl-carrier protein] reductase